jgi:hypothetical protein
MESNRGVSDFGFPVWRKTQFDPRDTCRNLRHSFRSSALVNFEMEHPQEACWVGDLGLRSGFFLCAGGPDSHQQVLKRCLHVVATSLSGFPLLH